MADVLEYSKLGIGDVEYIPLSSLLQMFENDYLKRYDSTFSIEPFIESLKEEMVSSCDQTNHTFTDLLENYNKYIELNGDDNNAFIESREFRAFVKLLMPSMRLDRSIGFLGPPFIKKMYFHTDFLGEIFNDPVWQIKVDHERFRQVSDQKLRETHIYILNRHYGQNISDYKADTIELRNTDTGIIKFYQLNINYEFVRTKVNGSLPELSEDEIQMLIKNIDNDKIWESYFPPSLISFYGFATGTWIDVTDIEAIAQLRHEVHNYDMDNTDPNTFLTSVSKYVGSLLEVSDIQAGVLLLESRNTHHASQNSLSGISGENFVQNYWSDELSGIYGQLIKSKDTVFIESIDSNSEDKIEQFLYKSGVKSLLLYPLFNEDGELSCIMELGARENSVFNTFSSQKLSKVLQLMSEGYARFMDHYENIITSIIQNKFTSIHPSIEWKFEEVANDYYVNRRLNKEVEIAPVVFEDLIPLYAQSDIVSSSTIRNRSIQSDLITNLEMVLGVMRKWHKRIRLHALEKLIIESEEAKDKVAEKYNSADESLVVDLLTKKIHPYLAKIANRYDVPKRIYKKYLESLDPLLNIIYDERKKFEESVTRLNSSISNYLEEEDHKLQRVLPHFFEKYKTDGIEYNIYLGQSILENGTMESFDISEFKLWQLTNMCEIVKLVDKLSPQLSVHLTTAQLIFVYNNHLSIRFRMDEKKFDVDGTYNVRYEILKKRIDKATIKGTGERLTVAGKIAIVYLNERDKNEYLDYLNYLVSKKYISEDIEELELNKMQGADGLKALRITVNT